MTADFVQIGPGGKRSEGQLTRRASRPDVVQIRRRRRGSRSSPTAAASPSSTTSSTPRTSISSARRRSSSCSADHIDLARDTQVLSVAQDAKAVTIEIEDKAALGGTAHLELIFDPSTFALKQWTVIDAQGYQTVVTLFNIDLTTRPDPELFHIDESLPTRDLGHRR